MTVTVQDAKAHAFIVYCSHELVWQSMTPHLLGRYLRPPSVLETASPTRFCPDSAELGYRIELPSSNHGLLQTLISSPK